MSKSEIAKILAIIYEAYHFFYKDSTDDKINTAIVLWHNLFKNDPYELVEAAVYSHIANSVHPPTVAHIKKEIGNLLVPNELSEAEAVALVVSAASNSIYNANYEYNKLPEILQKIVGSPRQLREYGLMDSNTLHSVVMSNLGRSYRIMQQREREKMALPDITKMYVENKQKLQ